MNQPLRSAATLLGRLMIVTIFVLSTVGNKIPNFSGVASYMASEGVPAPQLLLAGAILFLIVGSVTVLLGYQARFGAALLLTFLALATYYFHDFWNFQGQEHQMQMIQFLKNLSMMGTMVFLMANGPGPASVDTQRPLAAE